MATDEANENEGPTPTVHEWLAAKRQEFEDAKESLTRAAMTYEAARTTYEAAQTAAVLSDRCGIRFTIARV